MILIDRLDHLVLTVADIERSCDFYQRVLGMQVVRFGAGRTALQFGQQKINLHPASAPLQPHAAQPTPGSADLCLVTGTATADVLAHLRAGCRGGRGAGAAHRCIGADRVGVLPRP